MSSIKVLSTVHPMCSPYTYYKYCRFVHILKICKQKLQQNKVEGKYKLVRSSKLY